MTNIVSLTAERITRASQRQAYRAGAVALDFSDVVRRCERTPAGQFEHRLTDPVELGPTAQLQVRQLFWRCGLRQMPATWGELVGNWNYCRLLSMWLMGLEAATGVQEGMLAYHERRSPGRGQLLSLLAQRDYDGAWAWHQGQGSFAANAADPRLTRGTPSFPSPPAPGHAS
jgi:hypothetical protein